MGSWWGVPWELHRPRPDPGYHLAGCSCLEGGAQALTGVGLEESARPWPSALEKDKPLEPWFTFCNELL